jgi:protein O-GlcNAc transferase
MNMDRRSQILPSDCAAQPDCGARRSADIQTPAPRRADGHFNLANRCLAGGELALAARHYRRAIAEAPDDAEAWSNLGVALLELGCLDEAIAHCLRAIALKGDCADAYANLGAALQRRGDHEEAVRILRRALQIEPGHAAARSNLADVIRTQGHTAEAIAAYRALSELEPRRPGHRIKRALTVPIILDSTLTAERLRAGLASDLDSLSADGATLSDPFHEVGMTTFYLAYHGINDAALLQKLARFYLRACPSLGSIAPHCADAARIGRRGRLRIGILSEHLRDHTIGKLYRGIIAGLSREQFEVVLFRLPYADDGVSAAIDRSTDHVVPLSYEVAAAREKIAAAELDVMFYPDVGMEPFTYFVAMARLAPVQCVGWGHPVTTGIANIDYFLSAEDLEPPGADGHYCERLIRLNHLPTYYYRPSHPCLPFDRARLNLPRDARIYLCPQSLFKFHPQFDPVLGEILRRDPKARLVLLSAPHPHWNRLLSRRFARWFPESLERVLFAPRIAGAEFFRMLQMADAILEPLFFGGGNSTYEGLALGLPIVTLPGAFMRGRVTLGCYRRMGFDALVARTFDEYVELALRLANDPGWRRDLGAEIDARSGVLFEDAEAIRELERFLAAACDARRRGQEPAAWASAS